MNLIFKVHRYVKNEEIENYRTSKGQ